MLNEEILTDFVIKVGDEVIKTHKCILAKNSKVFHRMFEQDGMTEAQNAIILTDTTPECVRAMLEFFYTGMVSDDKIKSHVDGIFAISHKYQVEMLKCLCEHFMCSNIGMYRLYSIQWKELFKEHKMKIHVYDIFAIAHKYQVEMLKYLCERFMSRNIDDKNIIKCCGIIDLYGTTTLEKACINYIQANRRNFLKSKEWKKIKNNYSSLVPRFLEPIIERLNK
uniref:BTB domain-containing protein n=1 Tax=Meloidogyne incognita TaxID=6306 RepID=A0A914MJZ0_MELIC